tara:strand:- start:3784 stop:4377 length:594 start_codon:yes stop_codon:yes gene_type:complete
MERREALKLCAGFVGYSLSGIVLSTMLEGCKADKGKDWTPIFFTRDQSIAIADIADYILPRNETPGAKDIMVDRFIDKFVATCFEKNKQQEFLKGLEDFQVFCQEHAGNKFENCSNVEKDDILIKKEKVPYKAAEYRWGNKISEEEGPSFYRQLKGLILLAYFSSEEIGKNVLNYDPVPGKYIGCKPLKEIGNNWSL